MPHPLSPESWLSCMGKDLPRAPVQPAQPMRVIEGQGQPHPHVVHGKFPEGSRIALKLCGGRILLVTATQSGADVPGARFHDDRDDRVVLDFPPDMRKLLPPRDPCWTMLVSGEEGMEVIPIRVEEHDADLLGPRIFDELIPSDGARPAQIVRHIVKGPEYAGWTPERLAELEQLLCSEPFAHDPLPQLSTGNDWVGWQTRREALSQPAGGDQELQQSLVDEVFSSQRGNGSWNDSVTETGYGILQAVAVGLSLDDSRIRMAAEWLVAQPQPAGRPGMWMAGARQLEEWNTAMSGPADTDRGGFDVGRGVDAEKQFVMQEANQRVIPTCTRGFSGVCDAMMHISAIAADALCRCGYDGHPRVRDYMDTLTQLASMFGYFCSCWGILNYGRTVEPRGDREPDFNLPIRKEEHEVALRSIPYGHGRDADDLLFLANCPQTAGLHRPDLADTNGWSPYTWRDIGADNWYPLVGAYWQNADCWARSSRALTQYPGCEESLSEFFALFQCHLYQTSLGEWDQGSPAGLLRFVTEVTRLARQRKPVPDSDVLRFARLMVLRTVPWLRENQHDDGLWNHEDIPRWGDTASHPALSPRLNSYHIVSALRTFGLLGRLIAS